MVANIATKSHALSMPSAKTASERPQIAGGQFHNHQYRIDPETDFYDPVGTVKTLIPSALCLRISNRFNP